MDKKLRFACKIILLCLAVGIVMLITTYKLSSSEQIEEIAAEEEIVTKEEPVKQAYFYLSEEERLAVECIVMGESGDETYFGQMLVAYCILNACEKDGLQPSEVRQAYKYSGWHEKPTTSVKNAVTAVFDDGYRPVNDTPLWFYAPKWCESPWHEEQRFIIEVGGHRFFGESY